MSDSVILTPRRTHGGAAHTVDSVKTGHRLRIVRQAPGDAARDVYLATDHGLLPIGTVTHMGAGSFYALPPLGMDGGWPCSSFRAGAQILDIHIDASPVTTYLATRRPEAAALALLLDAEHIPTTTEV